MRLGDVVCASRQLDLFAVGKIRKIQIADALVLLSIGGAFYPHRESSIGRNLKLAGIFLIDDVFGRPWRFFGGRGLAVICGSGERVPKGQRTEGQQGGSKAKRSYSVIFHAASDAMI